MADYKAKQIGKVKGLGTVYEAIAPLDKQIEAFNEVGIHSLASPEEEARIRIAGVSNNYTRTNMVPVGVKGEKPILYRSSPFMNPAMASVAVAFHRAGKYPALEREFYDTVKSIAEQDRGMEPEDRRAIILQSPDNFDLTPEMEEARFILGNSTAEYFDKFNHNSIRFFNLPLRDVPKGKCFANYLWFYNPQNGSLLLARNSYLYNEFRASGVLRSAVGASSQTSKYTLTQVKNANTKVIPDVLDAEGLIGVSNLVIEPLNKGLLEKLRKR